MNRIKNIGVTKELDFFDSKKVKIVNVFSANAAIISLAYAIFLLALGSAYLASLDFLIFVFAIISLILNYKHIYIVSASLIFFFIPLVLIAICFAYAKSGAEYYLSSMVILAFYFYKDSALTILISLYLLGLFFIAKYFEENITVYGLAAILAPWFYYINVVCSLVVAYIYLRLFIILHGDYQNEIENKNKELLDLLDKLEGKNSDIKLLLRELNHRVKNNLQMVSSLLNLQAKSMENIEARESLENCRMRIFSISLVHKKLYLSEDSQTTISLKEYLGELLANIIDTVWNKSIKIDFRINVDDMSLEVDRAVSLGLIVNELVTNSLKHGVVNMDDAEISVDIKVSNENQIELVVADNGKGMEDLDIENYSSFGYVLVSALVKQLDGNIKITNKKGTFVTANLFIYNKNE